MKQINNKIKSVIILFLLLALNVFSILTDLDIIKEHSLEIDIDHGIQEDPNLTNCAGGIATGTAVKDGRSIFWKNRHYTYSSPEKPTYIQGAVYKYWMNSGKTWGMNEVGLAVGNFMQYTTLDNYGYVSSASYSPTAIMAYMLARFSTVEEAAYFGATRMGGASSVGIISSQPGVGAVLYSGKNAQGQQVCNLTWVNNTYMGLSNRYECDGENDPKMLDAKRRLDESYAKHGYIDWADVVQKGAKDVKGREQGTGGFSTSGLVSTATGLSSIIAVSGDPRWNGAANIAWASFARQPLVAIYVPLGASYLTGSTSFPSVLRSGDGMEDYVDVKAYYTTNGAGPSSNTYYAEKVREVQNYTFQIENCSFTAYDEFMDSLDDNMTQQTVKSMLNDLVDAIVPLMMAAYSDETYMKFGNEPPVLTNEVPSANSNGIPLDLSELKITIKDSEGDHFNWTIETSPDIGSNYDNNDTNGTKICSISGLADSTTYIWYVNATDCKGKSTSTAFTFTTEFPPGTWWNSLWPYRKEIVINSNQVVGQLKNFPVLINLELDADLALKAQSNGYDIVFTDYYGYKLNHEIELFNSSNGQLVAWVNVTNLSYEAPKLLYIYYGNPICDNQQNVGGTWDHNYAAVWHMSHLSDSTLNNNDLTNNGAILYTGKAGNCYDFASSYMTIEDSNSLDITTALTFEVWAYPNTLSPSSYNYIFEKHGSQNDYDAYAFDVKAQKMCFECRDSSNTYREFPSTITVSSGTWNYLVWRWDWANTELIFNRNRDYHQIVNDSLLFDLQTTAYGCDIGRQISSNPLYWDGRIDEIRISNIVRNDSWLETSYNNVYSPSTFYSIGEEYTTGNRISYPSPSDGTIGVSISINNISVYIENILGSSFNWTIETSPDIGSNSNNDDYNGTKTCDISGLFYGTTYTWYVNTTVNGNGESTKKIYTFTTELLPGIWWDDQWAFRKEITINHDLVTSNLTNFPVLISRESDADLALKAQSNGHDIVFTDNHGNKLNHEIELFNSSNGQLIAWVNVTSLSSEEDEILFMYYGNSLCGDQQNVTGTWDSNYHAVFHFKYDGDYNDSTGRYSYEGITNTGVGWGMDSKSIGYCLVLDSVDDKLNINNFADLGSTLTGEMWLKRLTSPNNYTYLFCEGSTYNAADWCVYTRDNDNGYRFGISSTTVQDGGTLFSNGAWHYMTMTWNNPTNYADIYRNTTNSYHYSTTTAKTNNYFNLYIMGNSGTGANARGMTGYVDEVRLSDIVRSSDWLTTSYNTMNNPTSFISVSEEFSADGLTFTILNPSPSNNSENISIEIHNISIYISNYNGKSFNWSIQTSPNIGDNSCNDDINGTKICNISGLSKSTTYTWYVSVYDGNQWTNHSFWFITETSDLPSPQISDIQIYKSNPIDLDPVFGWENITCEVTDDSIVDAVLLILTYPDGSTINYSMTKKTNTNIYYFNTSLTVAGWYYFNIWASNIHNNQVTSPSYDFSLPFNSDINMDGTINILDLVLVSNAYGQTGPPGWIREDVDNNGSISLLDLVYLVNHYGQTWW